MFVRKPVTAVAAVLLFLLLAAGTAGAAADTRALWLDTPGRALPVGVDAPDAYRAINLDFVGLRSALAQTGGGVGLTLALPRPDGGFDEFVLSDSGTMPPELAARYPDIRSFRGVDAVGQSARIDVSPIGLNVMVFGRDGIWVVRPVAFGEGDEYVSFFRKDASAKREPLDCAFHDTHEERVLGAPEVRTTTGVIKRTYRTAVAANSPYVTAIASPNPPTVEIGLAAVVVAMNRVNEIYENDLSIRMTLVPNNDLVIYPTAATDPYANDGGALNQNTPNLNAVIGAANYDIGHVFTTGSGGVAGLGVVCGAQKGRGTTGLSSQALLTSDVFYIDYVAHEIGHQFGANHTFNNSCGGNRSSGSAYEPGSGSTIMGYAGICAPNLQDASDPYFHARSLDAIATFTGNASTGGSCSANQANHGAPVVPALTGHTIPARTPFALIGNATSTSPLANLTFAWEQYDLGPATVNIDVDPGTGPIVRSLIPTVSGIRTIPKFENLLTGATMVGEILPATNRNLTFRLTARDNVAGGGTSESRDVTLAVSAAAGPFSVNGPPLDTIWDIEQSRWQAVTWNVAGTDSAPVSCAAVDIDLHVGDDFSSSAGILATNAPNTGIAIVEVPDIDAPAARVRVRCADNLFFAMSPGDIAVVRSTDRLFAHGFENIVVPAYPPAVAKGFAPAVIAIDTPSTLSITLGNPNTIAANLQTALVDTFPSGLVVAATPNASTTCAAGSVVATAGSGFVSLSAGAQIPANSSCTIMVDVQSDTQAIYENTIAAGALQTDLASSTGSASAALDVFDPAQGIVCSAPLNHPLAATGSGTSINWGTGAIIDSDPTSGYDFNLYRPGSGNMAAWWDYASTINRGVAPTANSANLSVLAVGTTVGPASVFSRTNGATTAWNAGASGYMGFRFNCSALGTSPSGTCYGYMRMTTTGPTGYPATFVDYCYDKFGNAIVTGATP